MISIEDDPFIASSAANGIGLEDAGAPEQYRAKKYEPALEQMVRAKYVAIVFASQDQPLLLGSSYQPGAITATGLLYEIDTKQLRGGVGFSARNTELVLENGDDHTNYGRLMDDLENRARAALWTALKTRFPSAKTPLAHPPKVGGQLRTTGTCTGDLHLHLQGAVLSRSRGNARAGSAHRRRRRAAGRR